MAQSLIVWLIVGVAALLVLRHVWREVEGLFRPDRAGQCPGCGMCEAAEEAGKQAAGRSEPKYARLIDLDKRIPARHSHSSEEPPATKPDPLPRRTID